MGQCIGTETLDLHESPDDQVTGVSRELTPVLDLSQQTRVTADEIAQALRDLKPPDEILSSVFPEALASRNENQLAGWLFLNHPRLTVLRLGGPYLSIFAGSAIVGVFIGLTVVVQRGSTIIWVFHDKEDDLTPIRERLVKEGEGKHSLEEYTVDVPEEFLIRPHPVSENIKTTSPKEPSTAPISVPKPPRTPMTPSKSRHNSTSRSFSRRSCGRSSIGTLSTISGNLVSPV
ncbi:Oidioi.mRNA.OKI2018_I69.chr2.g8197.t1.cds [Oikopleura dioica]|uniref:Oidioi.mRNA.OKI2018_I69.chr2.g8197.t1.cds n=1 Tax=Oikopleura dioica TaxID=34765 RepID=A0ABN7TEZ8_OIKDI|nr:Oidioi.mRNA.OKI2018_I69.chr2.g8197.t1.cds [Oikopleura dioica]